MKRRPLGLSGLDIPDLALGCMVISGMYDSADEVASLAIQLAADFGCVGVVVDTIRATL